jgi:hypothetical protein
MIHIARSDVVDVRRHPGTARHDERQEAAVRGGPQPATATKSNISVDLPRIVRNAA